MPLIINSPIGYRDSMDEKTKNNLVQIKGRFSVTSENLDLAKVTICSFVHIIQTCEHY